MKQITVIFIGLIMFLAVIPANHSFANKPDDAGIISVEKLQESKMFKTSNGKILEKNVHVFYKENHAKPEGKGKPQTGDLCYSVIGKGAIWKTVENYIVDEDYSGMASGVALSGIQSSINVWESEIISDQQVFASGTNGQANVAQIGQSVNGVNEVLFGTLNDPNVIAVTISWGYFSGPLQLRELVEWDMVFNTSFNWGNAGSTNENGLGDTSIMDFNNIAVHEIGHAAGLDHSGDTCTSESMYAYASLGETKKRTLETGDIAGINSIY